MSAESPRRGSRSQGGLLVPPQPVIDRSIIESVAGFINEVVPQGYASGQNLEGKDSILWARFEFADINDPVLCPDGGENGVPLLLVLGYATGAQVWVVPSNGEAQEVLSWRQGVVRTLRVLPSPEPSLPNASFLAKKRPIVAMCDSAGPGPQFCSVSFLSLRDGEQVKSIKFKHPVNDVLVNKRVVVITFPERIAVFDACKLEESFTVTTCYPCPGLNPNPVTLGSRWLAFGDRRLVASQRSSGGAEGEGVPSYTATVLHAAKSLTKGLRELGESVANSLTGQRPPLATPTTPGSGLQPGIVTVVDCQEASGGELSLSDDARGVIAHFVAHATDPVVALAFDSSGSLLLTADKQGHDFHIFRLQPHPCGPSLAAVHHLYVLHRGDTTAKVQDITFSLDSRWVAVSTLRGTTHLFPITPYGGQVGVRTHTSHHVVNRLSRFHRSAGLDDATTSGRNSPVPLSSSHPHETSPPSSNPSPVIVPYPNPRLPPYPHPTVLFPLAQLRQPYVPSGNVNSQTPPRNAQRQTVGRTSSEDGLPLRVSACFASPRAWLIGSPSPVARDNKAQKRAVDSLFVMACHGSLIEYVLEPKPASGIGRDKLCDDSPIELEVQARAQWSLVRSSTSSVDLQPPLALNNALLTNPHVTRTTQAPWESSEANDKWLSQVEIITHAGPHRRLWMGPQFTFKTYTTCSSSSGVLELEAVEVGSMMRPARSNPVNMPAGSGVVPVLIESGSGSSYDQSPRLMEVYGDAIGDSDGSGPGESQLREDLADAMLESPGIPIIRDTGRRGSSCQQRCRPVEEMMPRVLITVAATLERNSGSDSESGNQHAVTREKEEQEDEENVPPLTPPASPPPPILIDSIVSEPLENTEPVPSPPDSENIWGDNAPIVTTTKKNKKVKKKKK